VRTMAMDLGVNAVATRTLVDDEPTTSGRSVKLDTVEEGRFGPAWCAFVVGPVMRDTRCTRTRHAMFTQRVTFVHARGLSTRRCTHFEPGEDR
jgi:hypothetical protein